MKLEAGGVYRAGEPVRLHLPSHGVRFAGFDPQALVYVTEIHDDGSLSVEFFWRELPGVLRWRLVTEASFRRRWPEVRPADPYEWTVAYLAEVWRP